MSRKLEDIKPTTFEGIKSLAKQIKRELEFTHAQSLDAAARQAGFAHFAEAYLKLHKA